MIENSSGVLSNKLPPKKQFSSIEKLDDRVYTKDKSHANASLAVDKLEQCPPLGS